MKLFPAITIMARGHSRRTIFLFAFGLVISYSLPQKVITTFIVLKYNAWRSPTYSFTRPKLHIIWTQPRSTYLTTSSSINLKQLIMTFSTPPPKFNEAEDRDGELT